MKTKSTFARAACLVLAATGLALSSASADWIAGRDLAANEMDPVNEAVNPNPTSPQWSYAYRLTLASTALTLFTAADHSNNLAGSPDLQGYYHSSSGDGASASVNTSSDTLFLPGRAPLGSGVMAMHPSQGLDFSIVRWTAAVAGTYTISAFWNDIDSNGGNGATGSIVLNGVVIFDQAFDNGGSTMFSPMNLDLNAGDILDFATGARGDYSFDSTAFNATIVPEPSTYALIGSGLLGLVGLRRWRKPRRA